jgi:recombination protein RecA
VRCDAIPTGALSLDLALGIGGVPRGRIVEAYGPESSGKTTLVYHVLAEAQKLGGVCAFIDAEHSMDPPTRGRSAWTSTSCSSPSPATASRRLAMRKLAGSLSRTQTLCPLTNQIREKIGVVHGSPETQPGGRALKFYASQRLDIHRIQTLKDGDGKVRCTNAWRSCAAWKTGL